MQPKITPLPIRNSPHQFATLLKTEHHVYCTSQYIQWGNSTESIGMVVTTKPHLLTDTQAIEWEEVLEERPFAHAMLDFMEIDSESYLEAWTRWLTTDNGLFYLAPSQFIVEGNDRMPNGRLYFYSLFPILSAEIETIDMVVLKQELQDIMKILKTVVTFQQHPYVVFDIEENIPYPRDDQEEPLILQDRQYRYMNIKQNVNGYLLQQFINEQLINWLLFINETELISYERIISDRKSKYWAGLERREMTVFQTTANEPIDSTEIFVYPISSKYIHQLQSSNRYEDIPKAPIPNTDQVMENFQFKHIYLQTGFAFAEVNETFDYPLNPKIRDQQQALLQRNEVPTYPCHRYYRVGYNRYPAADLPYYQHRSLFTYPTFVAIDGDRTPMSYLEVALLQLPLDQILPIDEEELQNPEFYGSYAPPTFEMLEDEPSLWSPHFYYTTDMEPCVVLYEWVKTYTRKSHRCINRHVFTFERHGYRIRQHQIIMIAYATNDPFILW